MTRLLIVLTFITGISFGQQSTIDITIHSRVDTTKQEIKEIVTLMTNYLSSNPDIIYENPYWNEKEKRKYADFDFTRSFLYPMPSAQLLNYYKPTILSIEKEGINYAIKTLFNAEGLNGIYKNSNPWCITKIYTAMENGQWKLKNALPVITQNWNRKTIGKITFIYPDEHSFNEKLARQANQFCDSIVLKFQFPDWLPFDYYITKSGDELGKLLGFDFFFSGYTTGMGMNDRRILLSGFGSEWYPHEFVHLVVDQNKRHGMVNEGFATWLGGTMEKSFDENAKVLANQLAMNDTITFNDILHKKWGWQFAAFYTTGAILCKSAFDSGGITAIKKLLDCPADDAQFKKLVCELFKIKENKIDSFIRARTGEYLNNK